MPLPHDTISPGLISRSHALIDARFRDSPVRRCASIDAYTGARVALKMESDNPVRSFKGRGACAFVRTALHDREPLVTASAGNFGLALTFAARRLAAAHDVTVFAAESASPVKVARMRELGATVRLGGRDFDEAKARGKAWAAEQRLRFVEDGAEAAVANGAGTIALELHAQAPDATVVLVPLGNGALLAGIATWFRHVAPTVRVVGIVAEGAPCMLLSLRAGSPVPTPRADTIADGVAVRVPVPESVAVLTAHAHEVVAVSDAAVRRALALLRAAAGMRVEPSAALGVAALLQHRAALAGTSVATIITGANVAPLTPHRVVHA